MMKQMGKDVTLEDMIQASKVCHSSGLSFCHSLLIGGPGETMQTVQRTFDAILDMSPTAVVCMVGIRIFPGTRLYEIARKEGSIQAGQNLLEPCFYLSPGSQGTLVGIYENGAAL